LDGQYRVRGEAPAGPEELQDHDLALPVHAGDADAVVAHGADGAAGVSAVAAGILWRVVHFIEVPAVDVVDVAVSVVVDAVARDLAGVHPDVGSQVRVIDLHAGIDVGDDEVRVAR